MKIYELTYLISSTITSEELKNVVIEIESSIKNKGGLILNSENNPAQTLAYPIKKQSSGYFITLTFQISEPASNPLTSKEVVAGSDAGWPASNVSGVANAGWDKIKEIKEKLQKDQKILRYSIIVKKPVKELKQRKLRRPVTLSEFEIRRKPSIMETIRREEQKKEEKVDAIDLDKKLDELLSE